jgi:hypothetical protein
MPPGSKDVWQPPVGVDKAHNEWCTHVQCNKGGIYDPWLTMETCIANGFNYHEEGHVSSFAFGRKLTLTVRSAGTTPSSGCTSNSS